MFIQTFDLLKQDIVKGILWLAIVYCIVFLIVQSSCTSL